MQEAKYGTQDAEVVEKVREDIQQKSFNYSYLDEQGIVKVGSQVSENDVLVGKVYRKTDTPDKDISVVCKPNEYGVVDKIFICNVLNGCKLVKIKIRNVKVVEIGDKCCSNSAQKGTVGMVFRQEDMPFTTSGIVPDIIINPHALPSRMTVNMLMEILCDKKASLTGDFQDATAFKVDGEQLIEQVAKELRAHGYDGYGMETMMNGFTGEMLEAKIFIGPCYYHRLKHLVSDKIHARAKGNVQMLSRQPCSGRSREGGLRFGEMERDCMITHSTSAFLKERLFDMSDPYQVMVCKKCGVIVNNRNFCEICKTDQIENTLIPYAGKLLFQDLQAMSLKIQLNQ